MSDYRIVREKRKSFAAEVNPDFQVVIKAPNEAPDIAVDDFIRRKTKWINKQLDYFRQFNRPENSQIVSGCSVLYLGRQYQLIIEKAAWKNAIRVLKNKIYILSSAPQKTDEINAAFQKWLSSRAETVFSERLAECMKSFPNMTRPELKIRKLKKRWGSYLKKHQIVLNPDLIKASKRSIDYVIFHELCHALYPDHTAEFYSLLSTKMPDWRNVKEKMEIKLLSY